MPKLISDLALMLLTAGIVAVVFRRFNQPLVLGYILAGFLVGPYMPFFFTVGDEASIETWSEIGIIVLMFGLGLEFNLHKLISVGRAAMITAVTGVFGMLVTGYLVGQAMGWSSMDSIFLGGMLSMSSTIIVIKVFDELGVSSARYAQLCCGTLVIQDIAGVFMMIVLSTISVSRNISGGELVIQMGMLVLFLVMWLVLGIYILPTVLRRAEKFMTDETLLLVSLGICFGMVLLADFLGFSSALGAFLAGSLLAGTVHAERVERLTSGIKDLFGSVFFLSVGMMIEPAMIVRYIVPILIITAVTLVFKLVFNAMGVLLSGQSLETAVYSGCALSQIGEFAFIIASLGVSLGVTSDYLYPIIVAVSVITTLTTPISIRNSGKIYALCRRLLPDKLLAALDRYTGDDDSDVREEQDSDWANFLRRFIKRTALYGALMAGVSLLGWLVVYPLLLRTPLSPWLVRILSAVLCVAGIALFIRPMLDLHSTEFTTLWVKDRRFRLPLITLTVLRFLLIVALVFTPLKVMLDINSLWLLLMVAAAILIIYKSGWMSSAYISAEARFMANLNERSLHRDQDGDATEWLDEELVVCETVCTRLIADRSLKQLNWGHLYSVSVIRVVRGRHHYNMPAADMVLREGDQLLLLGLPEDLRALHLGLGREEPESCQTLRQFMESQGGESTDLFVYALPVSRKSALQGRTIRTSGLKETYHCMVLGLQRDKLPILQPDVNMTIQTGDRVWILGARKMAEKLLAADFSDD